MEAAAVLSIVIGVAAILWLYLSALATCAIARDSDLTVLQKAMWIICAWAVPVALAMLMLRSVAERNPEALPTLKWFRPIRWLLQVRPVRRVPAEYVGKGREGGELFADAPSPVDSGHHGGDGHY